MGPENIRDFDFSLCKLGLCQALQGHFYGQSPGHNPIVNSDYYGQFGHGIKSPTARWGLCSGQNLALDVLRCLGWACKCLVHNDLMRLLKEQSD